MEREGRKQRRKSYFYVLLTRCGACKKLKELKREQFRPFNVQATYVVVIARNTVIHPVSGLVTHHAGDVISIKEGDSMVVFECPQKGVLAWVTTRSFSDACTDFEEK